MTISNSPLSYTDCYEALDRALEDDRGVRVGVESLKSAQFLRMRLNQARAINRDENQRTYEPGHPLHGRSEYDRLMVRIKERGEKTYVYIEQVGNFSRIIESLSEVEPTEEGTEEVQASVPVETLTKPKQTNIIPMVIRREVVARRI